MNENLSIEKFNNYYIIHDGINNYLIYRIKYAIKLEGYTKEEIDIFKKLEYENMEWI